MEREWILSVWHGFYRITHFWSHWPLIKLQLLFFVIQLKIQSEESEEIAKFKELFPDMKSPESLYDKSPVG